MKANLVAENTYHDTLTSIDLVAEIDNLVRHDIESIESRPRKELRKV